MARRGEAPGIRDGYLRGELPASATPRQLEVLAGIRGGWTFSGGRRGERRHQAKYREAASR